MPCSTPSSPASPTSTRCLPSPSPRRRRPRSRRACATSCAKRAWPARRSRSTPAGFPPSTACARASCMKTPLSWASTRSSDSSATSSRLACSRNAWTRSCAPQAVSSTPSSTSTAKTRPPEWCSTCLRRPQTCAASLKASWSHRAWTRMRLRATCTMPSSRWMPQHGRT